MMMMLFVGLVWVWFGLVLFGLVLFDFGLVWFDPNYFFRFRRVVLCLFGHLDCISKTQCSNRHFGRIVQRRHGWRVGCIGNESSKFPEKQEKVDDVFSLQIRVARRIKRMQHRFSVMDPILDLVIYLFDSKYTFANRQRRSVETTFSVADPKVKKGKEKDEVSNDETIGSKEDSFSN